MKKRRKFTSVMSSVGPLARDCIFSSATLREVRQTFVQQAHHSRVQSALSRNDEQQVLDQE